MPEKIILAGAASVIGHDSILSAFSSIGMSASFIEAPFIKKYMKDKNKNFFSYMDCAPKDSVMIPLSEYWISQCMKNHLCKISCDALKASRSKKFLYEKLSSNGIAVPKIFEGTADARNFIEDENGNVIIKPEGLFSGYAVKIAGKENISMIECLVKKAGSVRNNATKLFEIENKGSIITEMIFGNEYSADLFLCEGRISLVRLCKKIVVNVHGTPCTAICQLVPCNESFFEQMKKWCRALFEKDDLSFAQFDFIDSGEGRLVPIDFACRVGGGMAELFDECESNVYAAAVLGKQCNVDESGGFLTQFNYLPTKSGIIENDDYNLESGRQFIYKHRGDFVPESPSSVASRIAVVVKKAPLATAKDAENLLIGSERIKFWK